MTVLRVELDEPLARNNERNGLKRLADADRICKKDTFPFQHVSKQLMYSDGLMPRQADGLLVSAVALKKRFGLRVFVPQRERTRPVFPFVHARDSADVGCADDLTQELLQCRRLVSSEIPLDVKFDEVRFFADREHRRFGRFKLQNALDLHLYQRELLCGRQLSNHVRKPFLDL